MHLRTLVLGVAAFLWREAAALVLELEVDGEGVELVFDAQDDFESVAWAWVRGRPEARWDGDSVARLLASEMRKTESLSAAGIDADPGDGPRATLSPRPPPRPTAALRPGRGLAHRPRVHRPGRGEYGAVRPRRSASRRRRRRSSESTRSGAPPGGPPLESRD